MAEIAAMIKTLRKERGIIKRKLTLCAQFLQSYNPETQYPSLAKHTAELDESRASFEKVQSELEDLGEGNLTDEGLDDEARNDFDKRYFEVYNSATNLLANNSRVSAVSVSSAQSINNGLITIQNGIPVENPVLNELSDSFKLPSLGLPSFSGSYDTWLGFHDVFSSMIDKNSKLSPILKFRHLRDCLKGEAAELIASVQLSAENYSVAWEIVRETYDNRKLIRQRHIQDLLNIPSMSKEFSIRALLNNVQKHVRALKILDESVDQWGSLLIVLIQNKMNPVTFEKWEESSCESELPTFQELVAFLQRRAQLDDTKSAQSRSKPVHSTEKYSASHSRANNRPQHLFAATDSPNSCSHCGDQHSIFSCEVFLNLSPIERFKFCKKESLCLNCLKSTHRTSKCHGGPCKKCQKKHNSLLHFENTSEKNENASSSSQAASTHNFLANQLTSENLLSTAIVDIINNRGAVQQCRLLLDNGSQSHYLTEKVASLMNLRKKSIDVTVLTLGSTSTAVRHSVSATIRSRYNTYKENVEFLLQKELNYLFPSIKIDRESLQIPNNIFLADPDFDKAGGIDGIIGVGLFYKLLSVGQIVPRNHPDAVLQKTQLGWIVAGKIYGVPLSKREVVQCNMMQLQPSLDSDLTRFWELEEVSSSKVLSSEEIACEEHFVKNTIRDSDGRYVVRLPFNEKMEQIGDSRNLAFRRLYSLENRFRKNPELLRPYTEFLREYEQLNHMSPFNDKTSSQGFYLPHHAVIKEDSLTTKVRVVFDGSAKSSSCVSLNDALMVGSTLQDDLFAQLIRFRSRKYALTADIEKMYRQIKVHPDDAIYQKIAFRANPDEPIRIFTLNTVTYGTACASFLSIRALRQLAHDEGAAHPLAASVLKQDFYVDDLLTGANTRKEALSLRDDLIQLLNKGGFILRKWASNDPSLVSDLQNNRESAHMALDSSASIKTLGIHWNSGDDSIFYTVNSPDPDKRFSKRSILSQVAKLFDPLGLLGPVIVQAKLMIQLLWKANVTWDEGVPPDIRTLWIEYISQLALLNDARFNRFVMVSPFFGIQLHGFCDASQKAYGACIYLRCTDNTGQHYANLLCSKSRVAPVKTVSLARLELCAALLLAKLQNVVIQALKIELSSTFFWSDSTVCLQWINTPPHLLRTFYANRATKIQALTQSADWRHVPSLDNPADLVSRGQMPQEFLQPSIWSHGPDWLVQPQITWPKFEIQLKGTPELKTSSHVEASLLLPNYNWNLLEKYSSLPKLQRVLAFCLRFINNAKGKDRRTNNLTVAELDASVDRIIQLTQARDFSQEIVCLQREKPISSKSKLLSLNPFLDKGILKVGGRLFHSELTPEEKHPILLPRNHHITSLIIRNEHLRLKHAGSQATLYAVRERYWPIDGRSTTRRVIHQCVPCFRAKPRSVNYVMGILPAKRIQFTRPFVHTGVDYCGPFFVKEKRHRNRNKIKCYVAVFVCLAIKATHLELVSDLTTEAFLAALKRFFARRGKCSSLISDNATNFLGASRELAELQDLLLSDEHNKNVQEFLVKQRVNWSFIPPRSPHFGGLWEAGVRSFKHHLTRTVGEALLTFEQLQTYVIEIEAILNSRPLSPLSSDPNDCRPLTPGHFLIGEPLTSFSQANLTHIAVNRLSAWQHVQLLRQHFWTRWHKEYLNELTARTKWKSGSSSAVAIGSLVVMKEDNAPPLHWKLGRIVSSNPGKDGIVRVVSVKTEAGTYKRNVKSLCPLPIEESDSYDKS